LFPSYHFLNFSRESVRNGLSIFESIYNATSKSNSSPVSTPTQEIPHKIENFSTGANNSSFFVERPWLFWKLVSEEGGIWSLLLLLARVVELQCDDDEISIALDLCFKTMLSSPNVIGIFTGSKIYSLNLLFFLDFT